MYKIPNTKKGDKQAKKSQLLGKATQNVKAKQITRRQAFATLALKIFGFSDLPAINATENFIIVKTILQLYYCTNRLRIEPKSNHNCFLHCLHHWVLNKIEKDILFSLSTVQCSDVQTFMFLFLCL